MAIFLILLYHNIVQIQNIFDELCANLTPKDLSVGYPTDVFFLIDENEFYSKNNSHVIVLIDIALKTQF